MRKMRRVNIIVNLTVEMKGEEVVAHLLFYNNTPEKIYLDYSTIGFYKVLTRSVFSVVDENNRYVYYSGMMASRRIVPEDFVMLNAGDSIKTEIVVNRDYELVKGQKYSIRFCVSK